MRLAKRSTIDEVDGSGRPVRQSTFSLRAAKGKLSVEKRRCPKCGHHKALVNQIKSKCSRCKQ